MKIFVADDNKEGLREFQKFLTRHGHHVKIADTIASAKNIIDNKQESFEIAVLDMVFPEDERGGFVLLKHVRQKRPDVQCIIVTAFAYPENVNLCMTEGVLVYDRATEPAAILKIIEHAYILKEGMKFRPQTDTEDMWALGMAPKSNKLCCMRAPLPHYKRNEVVAKTLCLGVCGTDVHTFISEADSKRDYALIEFHEALGEIIAKGPDVDDTRFSIGDWVVPMVRRCQRWNREQGSEWDFHIGHCLHWQDCRNRNQPDLCLHRPGYLSRGTGKYHGFGSEFFADVQDYLIKVTEHQREKLGSLCVLTEPLSVSWKVIREIGLRRGINPFQDRILVAGIGPIGMLCIAILQKMYPGTEIYAIDLFNRHRKVSVINKYFKKRVKYVKVCKDKEWPRYLIEQRNSTKRGFDIIIDATGDIADVFPKMCDIVNPEGILALLSVSGETTTDNTLQMRTKVFDKIVTNEVKIIGSVCASKQDMEDSLRFMSEVCDLGLLKELIFPKKPISPQNAPISIRGLHDSQEYLKILIQP